MKRLMIFAAAAFATAAPTLIAAIAPFEQGITLTVSRSIPDPEIFGPGVVSTGYDDSHPTFSADGRTLYFLRNTPDFANWTILVTHLAEDRWEKPEIAPFSGQWNDADVFLTRDGQRLFFVSNRPAPGRAEGRTDTDIWVIDRVGSTWGEPRHIPELSSEGNEWYPSMSETGVLYFGSERPGGAGASDLWRARRTGDGFAEPENLGPPINTVEQEIEPLISADESYLIFAGRRTATSVGDYDLFVSYRCGGRWTDPEPLPGDVNSARWDFSPRMSPDGTRFYFTSNRSTFPLPRAVGLSREELEMMLSRPGNGLRDIYVVDAASLAVQRACPGDR